MSQFLCSEPSTLLIQGQFPKGCFQPITVCRGIGSSHLSEMSGSSEECHWLKHIPQTCQNFLIAEPCLRFYFPTYSGSLIQFKDLCHGLTAVPFSFLGNLSKFWKVWDFSTLLVASHLACCCFTDAGRRQETIGSGTKDNVLLTAIAVAIVSTSALVTQTPSPTGWY